MTAAQHGISNPICTATTSSKRTNNTRKETVGRNYFFKFILREETPPISWMKSVNVCVCVSVNANRIEREKNTTQRDNNNKNKRFDDKPLKGRERIEEA